MSAKLKRSPARWPVVGDRLVEDGDLLAQRRQRAVDRRAVGLAVVGLRERNSRRDRCGPYRIDHRVDDRHPLLGPGVIARIAREQRRSVEDCGRDIRRSLSIRTARNRRGFSAGILPKGWIASDFGRMRRQLLQLVSRRLFPRTPCARRGYSSRARSPESRSAFRRSP